MITLEEKFYKSLDGEKKFLFEKYVDLLIRWNEKFNLTAITEPSEINVKHFADSIAAVDYCNGSLLDIGAGAGFPSVPLKIIKTSLNVTMADSLNKRVNFLNEVIKELKLERTAAVHIRAEEIKEREKYDTVVARAVAPLSTLAEYMLPFVKVGGKAIAYKSSDVENELKQAEKAIEVLGGEKAQIIKMKLTDEIERSIVIITKKKNTPSKYPRAGNKPRTNPIK